MDLLRSVTRRQSFCFAAAPLQAAASIQSLQTTFPDITLAGIKTVGSAFAEIAESLYADAAGPKEQLAARLYHIARELFFINKNVTQPQPQE